MPVKLSELAAKAKRDPYEFDPEDGSAVIVIAQPSIAQWRDAVRAPGVDGFLAGLGVSAADAARVDAVMPAEGLGTEGQFVASIRAHFGLGN